MFSLKRMYHPNCVYTKWEVQTQQKYLVSRWSGGGTSTEETEDTEEDLDLDFLAFLDFLSFPDFLDLRFDEVLVVEATTGTEPIVPPKGEGVPKIPGGRVIKGKGWLGAS